MKYPCEVLVSVSRTIPPVILATQNASILHECKLIPSVFAADVFCQIKAPSPGLYVWKGTVEVVINDGRPDDCDPYIDYEGEIHPATAEDVQRLLNVEMPPELFEERDSSE